MEAPGGGPVGETDGEADGVFEHPAVISATAATKQTRRICVYYTARNVGVPLRGRLGDVWDVSKRPESPLKRPAWPAWLECHDKDVRPWRQLHLTLAAMPRVAEPREGRRRRARGDANLSPCARSGAQCAGRRTGQEPACRRTQRWRGCDRASALVRWRPVSSSMAAVRARQPWTANSHSSSCTERVTPCIPLLLGPPNRTCR